MTLTTEAFDRLGNVAEEDPLVSEAVNTLFTEPKLFADLAPLHNHLVHNHSDSDDAKYVTNETYKLIQELRTEPITVGWAAEPLTMDVMDGVRTADAALRMRVADASWLIFFKNRRTGIAVSANSRSEAISRARKKKKRGGESVVSARRMTASEKKTAAKGNWVKSRPPGFKKSMRGQGPKPKAAK